MAESLKKQKTPCTDILLTGIGQCIHAKEYTEYPIDCYHRLSLTDTDLSTMSKIADVENKLKLSPEQSELKEALFSLFEEFYTKFSNPFALDIEYIEDSPEAAFLFYDYDYDYYIEKTDNGWRTYCRNSNVWGNGEFCECDTLPLDIE